MGNTAWRWKWMSSTALLLAVIFSGCNQKGQNPTGPTAKLRERPVKSTAAKTGQMPSDEECQQFAAKMEDAVARGDHNALNALIDWDAIVESTTGGIPGVESVQKEFSDAIMLRSMTKSGIGNAIIEPISKGGSYRFLRVDKVNGKRHARFRLLTNEGGLNYHDFILVRRDDGQIKAIDIYVYASGELLSQTFRRGFLPLAAHKNRSVLAKLAGVENDHIKYQEECRQMVLAAKTGQSQRALDIYARLPKSLKKDKTMLLVRVLAASQNSNEQVYIEAIEDFEKFHKNDPSCMLISIDGFIMREEYDKAIACIDKLNKVVEGDPYLWVLRANMYLQKGDVARSYQEARKVTQEEPTLEDAYWILVQVSLKKQDFDETNRVLDELERRFSIQFDDLTQIPEYAEYVKSPQYQEWLKRHPVADE